ncbi:hypothetical protein [Nocardia sp. R6R-6]|uniref:hypothetical protein n=1 Tax=Nocardia sp. R6R-6 TaxID=3459303 RepID=UPI00403D6C87
MVLDEVWRRLDGVEPLSGPQGGPLRRTVKLLLDPLVIRPVQHPLCAGPILTADGVVLLEARIQAAADVLRATAAWFTVLKQVRRTLRITEGHPQDLYFQRCFELATTAGMPDPARGPAIAEATLREIHEYTAGRTTAALKEYLNDHATGQELTGLLDLAWRRRPLTHRAAGDHVVEVDALLAACAAARLGRDAPEAQPALDRLVGAHAGTHTGIQLWRDDSGSSARDLGLTEHPLPLQPAIGASASKAALGLPFDRTVYERVFTVLQASSDRAELAPIPELVAAEIARSCAPWALLDESLRVTALAGAALALGLAPIGPRPERAAGRSRLRLAETGSGVARATAHQVINSRWQREAYVLQARRLVVNAGSAEPPAGPLAAIAVELTTPWRPYLRRLWVRLHGRDVREYPIHHPDELWDLLDGVARSVILDHRTRVKRALSVRARADEPGTAEPKAS